MISGLETPDIVDLRKRAGIETPDVPKELYQVLQEKQTSGGAGFFGSDRAYSLPSKNDVQLSINPDTLESEISELGDQDALREKFEEGRQANNSIEDDPRNKRKRRAEESIAAKRYKEFKF